MSAVDGLGALARARLGIVTAFEDEAGLGTVREDGGSGAVDFHCTAITDGSRHVAVGTAVVFELRLGILGTLEATKLTARSSP